jgi:ABC-type multidrug transport system ATPase subunit
MTTPEFRPDGAESLRSIPLFQTLSDAECAELESTLSPRRLAPDEVLFHQGDPGDALFLIRSGQVRIVSEAGEQAVLLARLGPGEFLGEMSLLSDDPRSAAAIAEVETEILELRRSSFEALTERRPLIAEQARRVMDARRAGDWDRAFANEARSLVAIPETMDRILIGRSESCDVVVAEPTIDAEHAEIRRTPDGLILRDLGSVSGTYCNRVPVKETPLNDGDEIWLGAVKMFLQNGVLKQFEPSRRIRLEAEGVGNVVRGGRRILQGIDLAIYPGELVALVGPSGAGKTTLLHDLLGFQPPTDGEIYYDSLPLRTHHDVFRRVLGYVPQSDIIHPQLTVEQTLHYAGRLRLPADTTEEELRARIDRVLDQVGLADERQNTVGRLSGGQRKRASIAVELLTEPRIFFLDEPTSGLDPGLDEQMMLLFRRLADEGRTVILTTHATRNLRVCDRVVVLSHGRDVFMGSPDEALTHFDVDDFIDVYPKLATDDPVELSERYHASELYSRGVRSRLITTIGSSPAELAAAADAVPRRPEQSALEQGARSWRQFQQLSARYLATIRADRPSLALLVLGALVVAALSIPVFGRDIFALSSLNGGSFVSAIVLLFVIALSSFFLGSANAAREITKEAEIYRRERLVDLSPVAYVASKVAVLSMFSVVQSVLLVGALALAIRFPGPQSETIPLMMATALLTSLAGMAMGLFISSFSRNSDQAMILVPLLLIP